MKSGKRVLIPEIFFLAMVLLGVSLFGYYETTAGATTSTLSKPTMTVSTVMSAKSVIGTSVDSANDTFITNAECLLDNGAGRVEVLIVSDSTGAPVTGESINAVDDYPCGNGQVLYINNFTVGLDGWLTPVLPSQASYVGSLNFTVTYQGATYHFPISYSPIGKECVTLHVPSGNVTSLGMSAGVCP
jgi:hypothetical protein